MVLCCYMDAGWGGGDALRGSSNEKHLDMSTNPKCLGHKHSHPGYLRVISRTLNTWAQVLMPWTLGHERSHPGYFTPMSHLVEFPLPNIFSCSF